MTATGIESANSSGCSMWRGTPNSSRPQSSVEKIE